MMWLTAHGILHRDLKLDNLLVAQDWTIKITYVINSMKWVDKLFIGFYSDFGLSIRADEGIGYEKFGGNIKFSAPEILMCEF